MAYYSSQLTLLWKLLSLCLSLWTRKLKKEGIEENSNTTFNILNLGFIPDKIFILNRDLSWFTNVNF